MRARKFSFFLAALIVAAVLLNVYHVLPSAYGHGLGKEETQPKNVGDRIAFLRAQVAPELKNFGELKDITLTLELVGAQTQTNILGTAYHLKIEKYADNKLLLDDSFHIMNDSDKMVVHFKTTESGDVVVQGQKGGDTLGYMVTDSLVVEGPVFSHAGLYKFTVEVVAMGGKTLDASKQATFEAYITLAESKTFSVIYNGKEHNLETISYFDAISDFKFDPSSKSITMTMPFNWSKDFVVNVPFLHAEIFIPKEFSDLAGQELNGSINGIEDPIFVDRLAADEVVVHYITPNKRLLSISDTVMQNRNANVVEFGLVAKGVVKGDENGGSVSPPTSMTEWSPVMEIATSGGSVLVEVQWSPVSISTDENVTFKLKFKDPTTKEELKDVRYDVMLYDPDGNHVNASHRSKQTVETQTYTFDRMGAFKLLLINVNNSGERAEFQLSVVPEFPVGVLIAAGAMIACMLALFRFKGLTIGNIKS